MNENIIIKETSTKVSIFTILAGLASIALIIMAFDMAAAGDSNTGMWFALAGGSLVLTFLIHFATYGCEIVVSDKRIYGKVGFGKRVDLPLDSVSAVATTSTFTQGVSVSTASGSITFLYLSNAVQIADAVRSLLINRQGKNTAPVVKQEVPQSNADELKKYKELLDAGVITQSEFEAKKKQLLGL